MICAVVLAAGDSSRLGEPKQLLDVRGKVMLQHVVDAVASSRVDDIVVVLGHQADRIRAALNLPERARVILNSDYGRGQSTSLRAGLQACNESADGAVIVLGDQPGMAFEAIDACLSAFDSSDRPVVRASYNGVPGHPVVLARGYWAVAGRATGDAGARSFLAQNPQHVFEVPFDHAAPDDVDTREDYQRLLRD